MSDFVLPHDFKFPLAILYLEKTEVKVMILWADSDRNRQDWADAFEYIKIDYNPSMHGLEKKTAGITDISN